MYFLTLTGKYSIYLFIVAFYVFFNLTVKYFVYFSIFTFYVFFNFYRKILDLFIYLYLSICLSIRLSVCLSISIYLSICLYVDLSISISLSIYLSIYLPVCLSIYLPIYLSVCLSVCLYLYLSICLSVSIYLYLSFMYFLTVTGKYSVYLFIFAFNVFFLILQGNIWFCFANIHIRRVIWCEMCCKICKFLFPPDLHHPARRRCVPHPVGDVTSFPYNTVPILNAAASNKSAFW
jgi:hypothetical protein